MREAEAEQHGEEQHREDIALGEGADDGIGDDVEQEVGDADMRCVGVGGDAGFIERVGIDVEPDAGLHDVADDQADQHRQRGEDFEIDDRLQADAADLGGVGQLADADDHGDEDDRRDHHAHQLHEAVAEGLHLHGDRRPEMAEHDTQHDGDEDLDVERLGLVRLDHFPPIPRPGAATDAGDAGD